MKPFRYLQVLAAAAAVCAAGIATPSKAQEYPTRAVRIIVPYPAGGGVDTIARPVADRLGRMWNVPVVVENKPGGGTIIGTEIVVRAPPDGYMLLVTSDTTITSNPHVYTKLPYDPLKDLAPVTQLLGVPQMVVAHPSVAANTLPELLALARSKPGTLNYASYGSGSQPQLVFENLRAQHGADITHVPYKGFAPALQATIAGETQLTMASAGLARAQVRAGKLKAIAIARQEREPTLPEVPTLRELGFANVDPQTWFGMFATGGTPRAVILKIQASVAAVFADPEFREKQVLSRSFDAAVGTPEAFAAFIRADLAYKARLVKSAGVQAD